ncbi:DUF6306 domain-containing protein [Oceanibacterium hippocampi]|uniref:DUF6306 domain-containing protein n=1 Tax=Oceanibacterium hippocampi TaxID=745714 RepID=A0A1Y5SVQ2_9PROT|nr:DUF6306 domain-containing protein [Oceanibacterium hippocampi]SLN47661.1 hypothetical protein OCH7691_02058 [Oceanibacterium hippocampi]
MTERNETAGRQTEPDSSEEPRPFASPPCFLPELDPAYLGYLGPVETVALLNRLLEGARAGARGIVRIVEAAGRPGERRFLRAIADDQARFCAMLSDHIIRLGGRPTGRTGDFHDRLVAATTARRRMDLLERGQSAVVETLRKNLARIADDVLHRDLRMMLESHERTIVLGRKLASEMVRGVAGSGAGPVRQHGRQPQGLVEHEMVMGALDDVDLDTVPE